MPDPSNPCVLNPYYTYAGPEQICTTPPGGGDPLPQDPLDLLPPRPGTPAEVIEAMRGVEMLQQLVDEHLGLVASSASSSSSGKHSWGPLAPDTRPEFALTFSITYPVVGIAYPEDWDNRGWATDDFCTNWNHPDRNRACSDNTGHAGNDLFPNTVTGLASERSEGALRVVAMQGGKVLSSACAPGAGEYVKVASPDRTRFYRHLHMALGSRRVALADEVWPDQWVGNLGSMGGATCQENKGLHLDVKILECDSAGAAKDCPFSPYPSLRSAFAQPGSGGDGAPVTVPQMRDAWESVAGKKGRTTIGWPMGSSYSQTVVGTEGYYQVNPLGHDNANAAGIGLKQNLGNGVQQHDELDLWRSGVILIKRTHTGQLAAQASVVHGLIFNRYTRIDEQHSFLGFPVTNEYNEWRGPYDGQTRQDFDGGCIVRTGTPGNPYQAYPYDDQNSNAPCWR